MSATKEVTVRVVNMTVNVANKTLLLDEEQCERLKRKALRNMNIELKEDETPLRAWFRVIHEDNGLEPTNPAHPLIRDAILNIPKAYATMHFLA